MKEVRLKGQRVCEVDGLVSMQRSDREVDRKVKCEHRYKENVTKQGGVQGRRRKKDMRV